MLLILLLAAACKKEPGEGGLATIEGTLYYNTYTPGGESIEKIPAGDEKVYLTYGDNDPYDDRNDTYTDGTFQFKNLQKGNYTVAAYSDCISCPGGIEAVEIEVEITNKKGSISVGELVVVKTLKYNDGTATIKGIIIQDEYTIIPPIVVNNTYPKPNESVYIVYGNDATYFDRVKTDADGVFQFTNLLKGSYKIYAFSDCANCSSETDSKEVITQISSNGEAIDVGTITIEKR